MMPNVPTVVHANDLVNASYSLTLNEMRLILLGCSKIDSKGKPSGRMFITCAEFEEAFGLDKCNATYEQLRNAAKSLIRSPIQLFDKARNEMRELVWLLENRYEVGEHGAGVMIHFSPLIEPYLFEIKERFTAINFEVAARLNTPFTFRLYQWLKEAEHQEKNKIEHGAIELVLGVEWMKEQSGIKGQYQLWNQFNVQVIKPAMQRINAETDLSVFHSPVKTGRKTTAVRFTFVQESNPLLSKPIRPRLARRPKVKAGSHAEGEWMRANFKILDDYSKLLLAYDPKALMDLADLRKYAEYAKLVNPDLAVRLSEQIADRTRK